MEHEHSPAAIQARLLAGPRHNYLRDWVYGGIDGSVTTVDEGLELLTGRPAGAPAPDGHFPEGSVNAAVEEALAANVRRLKELRAD